MAPDRRLRALAVLPALLLLATPQPARAAGAWWEPLALAGQRVDSVTVAGADLVVVSAGHRLVSSDGGRSFGAATAVPSPPSASPSPSRVWVIRDGVVLTGPANGPLAPDPRAPNLGASARLIAAPAALPGVVVAVGSDNHVWRRSASGQWATSFILLPAGGVAGAPRVTSVAAFAQPLSVAVYLGTDGYGVLLTEDGGDDWIRADPGLPENVFGLATDPATASLYAATAGGLYVHHLQAFPAPPVYVDASLYLRWLGIALIAIVATAAALLALRRTLPAP
jgi:hypothetical protein